MLKKVTLLFFFQYKLVIHVLTVFVFLDQIYLVGALSV